MTGGLAKYSEFTQRQTGFVSSNFDEAREWPRSGGFTWDAVGDTQARTLQTAEKLGLVERWGVVEPTIDGSRYDKTVWTVTDQLVTLLEEHTTADAYKLPCGHTGFVNDRESEYLHCQTCNGRFTQEEVERGRQDV